MLKGLERIRHVHTERSSDDQHVMPAIFEDTIVSSETASIDQQRHVSWADEGRGFEHHPDCQRGFDTCNKDHQQCPRVVKLRASRETYPGRALQSNPESTINPTERHITWADGGRGFEHHPDCFHGFETCASDHLQCTRNQRLRSSIERYPGL